jgi:hypothetical protein
MSNSNLFLYIGKPIKNEYGRIIGKVASFSLTPDGKFDSVYMEFGDGQFTKQPMENLRFTGAEITYITKIKSQAGTLCDHIPLIWRKDEALKDLLEKKKIAPEVFQDLHQSFGTVLSQLNKDAQVIIDESIVEIERCRDEARQADYGGPRFGRKHDESYHQRNRYCLSRNCCRVTLRIIHHSHWPAGD